MRCELYPGLRLDESKVRGTFDYLVNRKGPGFHMLAEDGSGRLVGIVAALTVPMLFFERSEAIVIACRAIAPGSGLALMRQLRKWADGELAIRRIVWPQEFHARPGAVRLARMAGFTRVSQTCTFEKE